MFTILLPSISLILNFNFTVSSPTCLIHLLPTEVDTCRRNLTDAFLAKVTSYMENDAVQAIKTFQVEENPFISQMIAFWLSLRVREHVGGLEHTLWWLRGRDYVNIFKVTEFCPVSLSSDSFHSLQYLGGKEASDICLPQHPAVLGSQEAQNRTENKQFR